MPNIVQGTPAFQPWEASVLMEERLRVDEMEILQKRSGVPRHHLRHLRYDDRNHFICNCYQHYICIRMIELVRLVQKSRVNQDFCRTQLFGRFLPLDPGVISGMVSDLSSASSPSLGRYEMEERRRKDEVMLGLGRMSLWQFQDD